MERKEKRTFGIMIVSIALLLGVGLWWNNLNAQPVIHFPTAELPEPNAFDYYVKAGKMHVAIEMATPGASAVDPTTDSTDTSSMTPQQLRQKYPTAAKAAWVKKCAPALQLLRQGFAYEYRDPAKRSMSTLFPHYARFRALARLLVVESHARSEQGDWTAASRSCMDAIQLGHDVPRGGPLIGALVGYAINAIGRRGMAETVPHLSAPIARAAARELESLAANRVTIARVLKEEKWYGQAYLLELMRVKGWRRGADLAALGAEQMPEVNWQEVVRMHLRSKQSIVDDHARYMDALAAQAGRPYQLRKQPALPSDLLNRTLLSTYRRVQWNAARNDTGNATLMLQLALHAFRLERGRYPAALMELTPAYLKQVPADPFGSGEALRYRRNGDSYLLYSIGPDGKDDGGKPTVRPGTMATSTGRYIMEPESQGDYVAGINR